VLADNPLGYWRLGEANGGTAADSSGNGRNGSYVNGVGLGVAGALFGDPNTAAAFDGVDDCVQVPDDSALRLNASWSIEFWAKQISWRNSVPGILGKGAGHTPHGYVIWADPAGALWFERNNHKASSGNGALTSSFHHFVVTYDGSNVRWYVNGVLKTTVAMNFPPNNGTQALTIGEGDEYGNNGIDEVALYSTTLSAARIAAHYAAGT
jgi:hypothetical protein